MAQHGGQITPGVSLRGVEDRDLPIFFDHQLDPEAARMAAFPSRQQDAFMAHWKKIRTQETNIIRTIVCNGKVVGSIFSWEVPVERNIGYWLGKEFWGRGIASAALTLFLSEVKQRPLTARVAKHNAASLRVLQKCGFTISSEGTFPGLEGETVEEFILTLGAPA